MLCYFYERFEKSSVSGQVKKKITLRTCHIVTIRAYIFEYVCVRVRVQSIFILCS